MPQAARKYSQVPRHVEAPRVDSAWSGDSHGAVGAMHRAIEERLLAGQEGFAVIPLPIRPSDRLLARVSRLAGWGALAACFVVAGVMLA